MKLVLLNESLNMASSGKKGKKSKGITLALTDFLQESSGAPTLPVKKYDWSAEVEDAFEGGYESRPKAANVVLPTAPRAARGPDISDDRIPNHPPFVAYISNLPYDIDEEDITEFFENMTISRMRLPRDDRDGDGGKLKGYGYVEFQDRSSLIDAISIIDTNLKGRRIKIDVATNSDGDRRRGGRMDMGRDRPERPEVAMGDWRSGPRSEPPPESRGGGGGGGGGFSRDRDRDRDGPSDSVRPGAWRDSSDRPSFRDTDRDRDRDRGFSRDIDRDRGFSRDGDRDRGFSRDGGDRDRDRGFSRDGDRDRGFTDRGRFGDRDRDRDGDRRSGFGPRRYGDRDREGFDRERDGDFRRGTARDDGPPPERDQARSRPKLVLAPRTKPLEEQAPAAQTDSGEESAPAAAAATTTVTSTATSITANTAASIFGAARPVDTSARERQIEERLEKEKETRLAPRDSSRDNKAKSDDEDKGPRGEKREAWGRKRNDDQEDRKESPDRRPSSRGPPPRRNDEKKPGPGPRDKAPPRKDEKPKKEDRPARENHEREMPKLKEPEPPNFAASNIFASLEAADDTSE